MKFILLILFCAVINSCENKEEGNQNPQTLPFSSTEWKTKKEDAYPYRPQMYRGVLYSDSIRTLKKQAVISMLGEPDREENNHFYYLIEKTSAGFWTLNQKSLVIKFKSDNTVEWIKMYE